MEEPHPLPQILSPSTSGRTSTSTTDANSPEFEFWMVRNPSFPQPNLLSADELFSDGILLPLHLRHLSNEPSQMPPPPPPHEREASSPLESSTIDCTLTASKRWRYIFKKNDKKSLEPSIRSTGAESEDPITKEKEIISVKEKKRDQKKINGVAASNLVSAAELNINIWPFSRSRSAGNDGTRPRSTAAATRKVSSAPCSRSNSTGESKSKKWPNSPSRAGVHLGRNSPVWKVRRGGGVGGGRSSEPPAVKNAEKGVRNDGRRKLLPASSSAGNGSSKPKVLSLNVPMCIGYRHHMSCRSDENSAITVAAAAAVTGFSGGGNGESQIDGSVSGEGVRRSNLFNIRGLFTKKVY